MLVFLERSDPGDYFKQATIQADNKVDNYTLVLSPPSIKRGLLRTTAAAFLPEFIAKIGTLRRGATQVGLAKLLEVVSVVKKLSALLFGASRPESSDAGE